MKSIFKKFTVFSLVITLCLSALCINVLGDNINVVVNGEYVDFTGDQAPFIDGAGRTLVPLRRVFEKLGSDVYINWDPASQMVTLAKGITVMTLIIGNPYITVTEEGNPAPRHILMDTVPTITNGRTMLPARFVAEAIGANVSWDGVSRTVYISSDYTVVGGYVSNAELSVISRGGKYGCIDKNRKIVVPIEYDSLDFNEFGTSNTFNNATYAIVKATNGGVVSYIGIAREHTDSTGKLIAAHTDYFDYVEAIYGKANYVIVSKNGNWGIMDAGGNEAIPVVYQEKPAAVIGSGTPLYLVRKNNLFGLSRLDGRLLTDIKYNMIGSNSYAQGSTPVVAFQEGYVCALRDGVFGYIGLDGRELNPFNFQNVSPFVNGIATVVYRGAEQRIQLKNGTINFIGN